METYWGRIRQLSASSPFCCHYPQAPPRLMAGQPARNGARPKSKGGSFQFRPSSYVPQTGTPPLTLIHPHPSTTRTYHIDASETRRLSLFPQCISYTRQSFGSLTRDSASRVTVCQPFHSPALPSFHYTLPQPTSSPLSMFFRV